MMKRTGVQVMPRASLCTSSCDLVEGSSHASSLGAFASARVSALKLQGLIWKKNLKKSQATSLKIKL